MDNTKTENPETDRRLQEIISSENPNTLPLIIKRYDNGAFTSELISPSFDKEIMISCGKGNGLGLHEKPAGKIIIFAGGTGICPFIDLIDVLFKRTLCQQGHSLKNRILNLNP